MEMLHLQPPQSIDLEKDRGLTLTWADGTVSFYPVVYLRKMSPSAEARKMRETINANPLTVLPARRGTQSTTLMAESIEMVGRYAIRIIFSDGHHTGLFSWQYLREIAPESTHPDPGEGDSLTPHA